MKSLFLVFLFIIVFVILGSFEYGNSHLANLNNN